MQERRIYERHIVVLPTKLETILTPGEKKVFDVETRNISIGGAFIYTKEASFIPDDTQFIVNSSNPNKRTIKLKKWKRLENCAGTMVRSTLEGIAIRFNRPVELFV